MEGNDKVHQEQHQTMLRYVLGELSDTEQEQFEEEYFADPQLFQQLQEARNDLMDSYVRDELPAAQRARFEQYFLASPRRRERVELARALAQEQATTSRTVARTEHSLQRSGWFTLRPAWIFAAAMILLLFGMFWFLRSQKTPAPSIANHTPVLPSATARVSSTAVAPAPSPTPRRSPLPHKPVIATFALSPVLVRDNNETQLLIIPATTEIVHLQLELEAQRAVRYQARLRTPEGTEILRVRGLTVQSTSQGPRIVLSVAARLLRNMDYIVQLEGATGNPVDRYYFRVEKK